MHTWWNSLSAERNHSNGLVNAHSSQEIETLTHQFYLAEWIVSTTVSSLGIASTVCGQVTMPFPSAALQVHLCLPWDAPEDFLPFTKLCGSFHRDLSARQRCNIVFEPKHHSGFQYFPCHSFIVFLHTLLLVPHSLASSTSSPHQVPTTLTTILRRVTTPIRRLSPVLLS
ncbi:hypothetical protein BD324DRAFT_182716 [Kockovaella imperatae]|uniref:Uncharacterized protein n=1 Tax=Kockovaella imperatae TaxID=4999 RepID=A0A1Y1U8T7_9TREE|nr:hypothetical protein BD324DRAFT_182716 [Kockovaella imperatae]ORX33906.1 hypothetical protein BD324DRAFT_182716 [Kockovaella imperatae]